MELLHGTKCKDIKEPKHDLNRPNIDFGNGFYLTEDPRIAEEWAAKKTKSYVNVYCMEDNMLESDECIDKIIRDEKLVHHKFECNIEWLLYVIYNRFIGMPEYKDINEVLERDFKERVEEIDECDVLIGPIADRSWRDILNYLLDGLITTEEALNRINSFKGKNQYVLKNEKSTGAAKFIKCYELTSEKKKELRNISKNRKKLDINGLESFINRKKKSNKKIDRVEVIKRLLVEYKQWKEVCV